MASPRGRRRQRPTIDRLAADVAELAGASRSARTRRLGWSLGASVLWQLLAGPGRDRFAGAVVVDMTPRVLNEGDWTLGLSREVCERARRRRSREDFDGFAAGAGAAIFAQPLRRRQPRPGRLGGGRVRPQRSGRHRRACGRRWSRRTSRPLLPRIAPADAGRPRRPQPPLRRRHRRPSRRRPAECAAPCSSTDPATRRISSSPSCSTAPSENLRRTLPRVRETQDHRLSQETRT